MGLSNSEEIHHAIVSCKEMIKTAQTPEEKKSLVRRLIQLRIKQQESKVSVQMALVSVMNKFTCPEKNKNKKIYIIFETPFQTIF